MTTLLARFDCGFNAFIQLRAQNITQRLRRVACAFELWQRFRPTPNRPPTNVPSNLCRQQFGRQGRAPRRAHGGRNILIRYLIPQVSVELRNKPAQVLRTEVAIPWVAEAGISIALRTLASAYQMCYEYEVLRTK